MSLQNEDYDGDGRSEILVTSPWGLGVLELSGSSLQSAVMARNGTRFDGWLLNTADNHFQIAADLDGDGRDEILVASPWGLGVLKQSGSTLHPVVMARNGTRFGGWVLNTADNRFGPAVDFDGDGRAEILVTSPWGIAILKLSGSTFNVLMMARNGTRFGGWLLNTADNLFGPSGDMDGDGRAEILVTSPWGLGLLKMSGRALEQALIARNGTRFDGWSLNTADNHFGIMADYDGDKRAEILVTSPWGLGILALSGSTLTSRVMVQNGRRIGEWLLNTLDNRLGPVADLDGDGREEILLVSPWGIGVLNLTGSNLSVPMMARNGTRFGGWLLNTADNRFDIVGDYDNDGRSEILVKSPWGLGILKLSGNTMTALMMAPNGTRFGDWLLNTKDNHFGIGEKTVRPPIKFDSFISESGKLNTTEEYIDPHDANRHYQLPTYEIEVDQNRYRVKLGLTNSSDNGAIARLKVNLTSSLETSNGKSTGQHTMEPGTGFIFSFQKVTSGTGVDRDIWWNRLELVPNNRMYSLGRISSVDDIIQIATGEFKFDAFVPSVGEGFAVEIKRDNQVAYAILHIISVTDNLTFEWLYPFKEQVTGHSERSSRSKSTKVTRITFDRFPDGTPIRPDRFLTGDEFLSKGIHLAGSPESSYCSEATATAIRRAGTYSGVTFPFLTTASPGDINRCNSIPVAITFTHPTCQVTLTFAGASVTYVMKSYDSEGRLLRTVQQDAVFNGGTFDITCSSETANISKVTFGHQAAMNAVKEIRFETLESTNPSSEVHPLPHDVKVLLQYVIPEKVGQSRVDGTWKDIEFGEVKQEGEKEIQAILDIHSRPELDGIYRAMSETRYRCRLIVNCEANLCYQPSPDLIDEKDQPTYIKVRASYDQILPFHFPRGTHGYIYPPGYTPTVEIALVRYQVSPDQAIYQDTTQPSLFYYLPEEFRLTRDDVAPYQPSLQIAFHTLSAQTGNTPDLNHQVEFTFKAVPYLRRERLKAALRYIEQNNLVPGGTIPSLAPLNPESARFFLTLPKDEGGFEVMEQKEAHVVFNRHIIDTLMLSSKAFAEVFHSMRVGGETLNGHVKVKLPGRDDEQEIPFSGRLDRMVGSITEQFLVNQSSVDQKTYKINIINAVESPLTLYEGIFYLRFDPDQDRWTPATAAPETLPLSLRSGEEKEIILNANQPISHAWSVRLEPIKTKVELDFEALWLAVQETPGWKDLTHDVTVQVHERYFSGPQALDNVIVTFNDEEAIVTLTRDEPSKTVNLIKPFLLYLLRDEEANDYVYKVASYRNQQLIATGEFPKGDAPVLDIVPPLEA